jgi:hypothetical protein
MLRQSQFVLDLQIKTGKSPLTFFITSEVGTGIFSNG